MPKLWTETIEAHRSSVADAIMDKTAALAAAEGLHTLTMARIAQETGIGRATLYKYFGAIEEILERWHQREVTTHLETLLRIRAEVPDPLDALQKVLLFYAANSRKGHNHALGALLHTMPHVRHAQSHLQHVVADLIAQAIKGKALKSEASPSELARFALAAIAASEQAGTKPALERLVRMILRGMGGRP